MTDKPKPAPKPQPKPDKEVKEFIEKGGRPGAGQDFNEILKRAAKKPKGKN